MPRESSAADCLPDRPDDLAGEGPGLRHSVRSGRMFGGAIAALPSTRSPSSPVSGTTEGPSASPEAVADRPPASPTRAATEPASGAAVQVAPSTVSPRTRASEEGITLTSAVRIEPPSRDDGAPFFPLSGEPTPASAAPPSSDVARAIVPAPGDAPGQARPIDDAPADGASGVPVGPARPTPSGPARPTPKAGPTPAPTPGGAEGRESGPGRSPGDLPPPRGADLIAEMATSGREPLGESLTGLLGRFGALADPPDGPAQIHGYLVPLALAAAAFATSRRWRRRQAAGGMAAPRGPRGFAPDGLA